MKRGIVDKVDIGQDFLTKNIPRLTAPDYDKRAQRQQLLADLSQHVGSQEQVARCLKG